MNNYGSSSLMIKFNKLIDSKIIGFANAHIPVEFLKDPNNNKGVVDDPHVSLLTDLEIAFPESSLRAILEKVPAFKINFGAISFFKNDDVDVIKIEIESKELNALHYQLKSLIPNHYKFDEYNAHCTLAFVQPNTCDFILQQANYFQGMNFTVDWINYNSAMGVSHTIKINKML